MLVIVSTAAYVGVINAGAQGVNSSRTAMHNITYRASSNTGGKVIVTYTQGKDATGGQIETTSPWSIDTTVTGTVAVLTVSISIDTSHMDKQEGLSCAIVDNDTGETAVTNTVPPTGSPTVTCIASNLGA